MTHATHLFNRMSPLTHRAPGVVGAVLESAEVAAEIICDGHHVHPAVVSLALQAKTASKLMAITDGTAAAGLPLGLAGDARRTPDRRGGAVAHSWRTARLAGSIITMDQAFRMLVLDAGLPIEVAARMCSTTPADQLGLPLQGRLAGERPRGPRRPRCRAAGDADLGGGPADSGTLVPGAPSTEAMSQTMPARFQTLARTAVLVVCAAAAPACEVNLNTEGVTSKDTRTFAVTGQPDLTLETFDGAIEIHSWDRNEVEVEIEKRAMEQGLIDQMTVEAQQEGDRIVLRVKGPARRDSGGLTIGVHISPAARLRVAVPRNLVAAGPHRGRFDPGRRISRAASCCAPATAA